MKPSKPNEPEIARELRLAKEYWLSRIHPHIASRSLSGVELHIAVNAHRRLRQAQVEAKEWNKSTHGKNCPVPAEALADLDGVNFHEPEPLYADGKLKPEMLAAIAAPMMNAREAKLAPIDAVRLAHELLRVAEHYVTALPQRKTAIESFAEEFDESRYVTFAEISRSNKEDSCRLPLLPPEPPTRNKGQLELSAIKAAVKSFWERHPHVLAQAQIHDELTQGRILWVHLCELRWERFKRYFEQQKTNARKRSPSQMGKPKTKKLGKTQKSQITSAAKSPLTAGKRET